MVPRDHYVRMTVAYDGTRMLITHIARVSGSLARNASLTGTMVYEFVFDGQRISSGAFPDPRAARSLGNFQGADDGPIVMQTDAFEFSARLPGGLLTTDRLDDLTLSVYALQKPDLFDIDLNVPDGVPLATATADAAPMTVSLVASQKGSFINDETTLVTRDALEEVLGR